jgi:hypothetical protein
MFAVDTYAALFTALLLCSTALLKTLTVHNPHPPQCTSCCQSPPAYPGFQSLCQHTIVSTHLSSNSHQGHAVHHGISQASDQVGGTWATGGNAHTHTPCGLGIALSCKDLAL